MLTDNLRTHASLQNHAKNGGDYSKGKNSNIDDMDVMMEPNQVEKILEEVTGLPQYEGKRASKLGLDDFLDLLSQFNQRGIHFS